MDVVLHMFRDNGHRRSFPIKKSSAVIGRREDCDLRIPLGEVSRKHCRVLLDGDDVRLEDLGSSNGTFHNGTRVQEAELEPGDTVQIGPLAFVVQIDGFPAEQNLQPVLAAGSNVAQRGTPDPEGLNPTAQADAADDLDDSMFASTADITAEPAQPAAELGLDDDLALDVLNEDADKSSLGMIDFDEEEKP